MTVFRAFALMLAYAAFMGFCAPRADAAGEGGMIPYDSPVGEIGGLGHWYALRSLKAEEYYGKGRPLMSDIRENEDGTYSVSGEPPIDITLVIDDSFALEYRWRKAINWVREAEQMFRNSGVPLRFVIVRIVDVSGPDTMEERLDWLDTSPYRKDSDLVLYLAKHYMFDPACGVTYLNAFMSVSGCNSRVLAHEIGHQFGLRHSFEGFSEEPKGFCMDGDPWAKDCAEGTIMSYGVTRHELFADNRFKLDGKPLGDAEHTAVQHLNKVKTGIALRAELYQRSPTPLAEASPAEPEICP